MADYKKAIPGLLENEGEYVNDSRDSGKETYKGITMRWFPDWEGWKIIHKVIADLGITDTLDNREAYKKISVALRSIPELAEMTIQFYKKEFWDKLNLDNEPDQDIANYDFDMSVNNSTQKADRIRKDADA